MKKKSDQATVPRLSVEMDSSEPHFVHAHAISNKFYSTSAMPYVGHATFQFCLKCFSHYPVDNERFYSLGT